MPDTTYQPKVYRKQGGDEFHVANSGILIFEDSAYLKFGDDSDIIATFNGTNLVFTPAVNDTGSIIIGNGTTDMDLKIFMGASDQYVLFDSSTASVTFAKVDVSITGDLTIDLEDIKLGDGQSLEFGDADGGDIAITFTDGTALAMVATASSENLTIGDDTYAINTTLKGTFTIGKSDTGHDVIFYGATAANYLQWDESEDDLLLVGTATQFGVAGTTDASSSTTGSIHTAGGLGVAKKVYVGTDLVMVGGDIDLSTADTGTYDITVATNKADALSIKDSAGDLIVFTTTTGSQAIAITPATSIAGAFSTGADAAGVDATFYGAVASYKVWFDANGDTNGAFYFGADTKGIMTYWYGDTTAYSTHFDPSGDTNGAWYFGADTKGLQVNLYGDVTGCGVFWDPSTDTNGTLTIGGSGGSKGNDVVMYGASNGSSLQWDQSADSLIVTSPALNATTGRALKVSATMANAAMDDGYGMNEIDCTLTGTTTAHAAASSSWINIGSGVTCAAGNYVCARNDGVYEDSGATITNAKIIFGARMQKILGDTDALSFPFSLNTNNQAITALFDCNTLTDFGVVSNAGSDTTTLIPVSRDAGGTVKYLKLYDLA